MLRLFSRGHLAVIPIVVASGFIAGTAPVVVTHRHTHTPCYSYDRLTVSCIYAMHARDVA